MRTLNLNEIGVVRGGFTPTSPGGVIVRAGMALWDLLQQALAEEEESSTAEAANGAKVTCKGKGAARATASGTTATCGGR